MSLNLLAIVGVTSFLVTLGAVPLCIVLGKKFGVLDKPDARKVHAVPIPRVGGMGIFAGLIAGSAVGLTFIMTANMPLKWWSTDALLGLLVAATLVALVGFVDDICTISSRIKLLAVLFAGATLYGAGAGFNGLWLGNGFEHFDWPWSHWFLTLAWIGGITVAVNFIDGLDGLAAGLVLLASAVLSLFLAMEGVWVLAAISTSLCCALLGFLVFNRHPARIFMGDCGSMLIGVSIAALILLANREIGTVRGMVLPSLALAVPIADGSFTFFRRHYLQRRSIFSAERGHIHHRLLDRGLSHPQAVWLLYIVSVTSVGIGLLAISLEGMATLTGLSLLIPLFWGTFRFAGSVKTTELIRALRSKRELDRRARQIREEFESLQLEFDKHKTFGDWWSGVCHAGERLGFAKIDLELNFPDNLRHFVWNAPHKPIAGCKSLNVRVPVADSALHGGIARFEVDIVVEGDVECASQKLAYFSRLMSERGLAKIRQRERDARAVNAGKSQLQGDHLTNMFDQASVLPQGRFGHLKVALVHDFYYTYCGAERVIEQLIEVFPHCELFAMFDFLPESQRDFLRGKPVTTTFVQNLPMARTKHRAYLPLMPLAIEQLDVSNYDLVISSSYLAAKGVITGPNQQHICYCHSPARYAWDLQHQYLAQSKLGFGPKGLIVRSILHYIRNWDARSSLSVDHFIANSRFVANRIKKLYRRQAQVIHPPVNVDDFQLNKEPRDDFYLVVGRMAPYKCTSLVVKAFAQMPQRKLVVIGEGPEWEQVKALATDNIALLGFQEGSVLIDYMRRAKALVFAAEEDFGIVPVEALCCGTPVIAFGRGGVTESVSDGLHGILFQEQSCDSIIDAVGRFESKQDFGVFDPEVLRKRGESFSNERFRQEVEESVARWLGPLAKNSQPVRRQSLQQAPVAQENL